MLRGDRNDPPPQWAQVPGGGHGELLPRFERWVKEISPTEGDQHDTK
jgi:hypothetical protein